MTTPQDPNVDPSAPPVASPAPGAAGMDDEIRQLARALAPPQVDALSARKAVVDSVSLGDGTTAPTVQVDLSGVLIPGVRLAASYTPVVGDTVLLLKQGNEFFAAFKIADVGSKSDASAGGWNVASLASGNSPYNGSVVAYRRVLDHGAWKMQWKGLVDYGNSSLLASALDAEYRPSESRPVGIGRSATGGAAAMRIDFDTNGTATFYGATTTISLGTSGVGGVSNHNHGGVTGNTDPVDGLANDHNHSIPMSDLTHTHALGTAGVTAPPWVSLNGVEYFL